MARAKGTRHEFVFDEETEACLQAVMDEEEINATEAVRRALQLYHEDRQSEEGRGALVLRLRKVRELAEQTAEAASLS